jgi:hypothetical protein
MKSGLTDAILKHSFLHHFECDGGSVATRVFSQGCQMKYFQTKNRNLGKFWMALK